MKRVNTANIQENPQSSAKAKMQDVNKAVNSIVLDAGAAMRINKGGVTPQEAALMSRNDVWHKIHVTRGGQFDNELVLRSVLLAVKPNELIPVHYTVGAEDSFFLVRNCEAALKEFCSKNLIIRSLNDDVLLLKITLGFASIRDLKTNIRPLLMALLKKRYIPQKKAMLLHNLHRDCEIANTVYCPLSQRKTLANVLNIVITEYSDIEYLSLQQNDISDLSAMETSNLQNIKTLDLRRNKIMNIEALNVLRKFSIKELWLDGNPLCDNYSSPKKYVKAIKTYCPQIRKLDGVFVGMPGTPIISQTFSKSLLRAKLVFQFLDHFFTLYDECDREVLRGLYHRDAIYSLSINASFAKDSLLQNEEGEKEDKKLTETKATSELLKESRNLLTEPTDSKLIYFGEDQVMEALKKLPETQHLKEDFTFDVIFDDGDILTFCVDGIFRDRHDERFIFSRTFILTAENENEYKIINDQNLIYFTSGVDLHLDRQFPTKKYISEMNMNLSCFSLGEKEDIVRKMRGITRMNKTFCSRFLEEAEWDIRKAVIDFCIQLKADCIPNVAFMKDEV